MPEVSLFEYIQEDPDLSIFSNMLKITGYDTIMDASQSYTVWAPVNDALTGIDTNDTELVLEIIRNHIARSRYTTSGIVRKSILMLNGKYNEFARESSGFTFGEKAVLKANQPATNGLIHTIDGYAPYANNLWEYIGRTENLDSLREFLYSQEEWDFDAENSVEIGVDTTGLAIYDSIFILKNKVLEKLGAIDKEDSIYTAIMPDNSAWEEAYARTYNYFVFPLDAGSQERQREMAQYTIIRDMLYQGTVTQPGSLDSLVSTSGNVYYEPASLFQGLEGIQMSNGLGYVTSQMPFPDTLSWFRKIQVEAEETDGRENANSLIFLRNSYGSGLDVSKSQYILVDPINTASDPSVKFSIPNTLSATYNIYCVFVPESIVNPSSPLATKVSYKLSYVRRESGSVSTRSITPANNVTSPDQMTRMLVEQLTFPYANVIDEDYSRLTVRLEVVNEVTSAEEQAGEFTRTMRIDCIILEPVLQ